MYLHPYGLLRRGTFSKTSRIVSGRKPFAKDYSIFNYDYDSEAEWEEEDPEGVYCERVD